MLCACVHISIIVKILLRRLTLDDDSISPVTTEAIRTTDGNDTDSDSQDECEDSQDQAEMHALVMVARECACGCKRDASASQHRCRLCK